MNDLHLSATSEQRILIEQAEERGFEEGMKRRAEIDIAGLEAHGFKDAAAWLRDAKIVERTDGNG